MNPSRILQLNAASTMAAGVAMLLARSVLHPLFGIDSPLPLDVVAVCFVIYAAALWFAATQTAIGRRALLAFSALDALWVLASVAILLLFWGQLTPAGRFLLIAVALVVEGFATAQFLAARQTLSAPERVL